MRSLTEQLFLAPQTRHGADQRVREEDVKDLDDDAVLYSVRGEAPEGWYNAGTAKHAGKGTGYQDHQIFKKLPTAEAAPAKDKKDKPVKKKAEEKAPEPKQEKPVAPSRQVTEAKERVAAYDPNSFGAYGVKKSAFAERSSEIYNPNEGFETNQQTTITPDGDQQAQSFAQRKLSDVKNKYNFQPTLS